MTDQEIRTLDMFKRVRNFDATHDNLFPTGTLARDLFDVIAGSVNDLEGFAAAQSSGRATARLGTTGKGAARAAIMEDLRIIRRTARSMAIVMPGLDDKFRIPRNPNNQELLDTARAFLAGAEPLKAEFLRREVRESVFQDLAANIAAFESALGGQHTGHGESAAAVASIDAAIDRATDALRQLDPIVRNKLHNDHATLAAWEGAKRIERASRRSNPGTPQAPPEPKQ